MSNYEPTKPYVYQPESVYKRDGSRNELIYGIAGPGAEEYSGKRFTREEAYIELQKLYDKLAEGVK